MWTVRQAGKQTDRQTDGEQIETYNDEMTALSI